MYPDSSNTAIRELLKNKRVYVDNILTVNAKKIIEKDHTVIIKQIVKKIPYGIEVIFEDKDILIINKPENLLSVPLDNEKAENALYILRRYFNTKNIFVVHRIDKATSGIMMFAKNQTTVDKLNRMFKNHELARQYLAVVSGNMKENKGTWRSYLLEDEKYNVRSVNKEKGKIAVTHFEVVRRSKNFTYLKLNLETGRKHQIRVHCKDAGHPILGDKRYSLDSSPVKGMCLHAYLLAFSHPITEEKMSFTAPAPKKFKRLGNFQ